MTPIQSDDMISRRAFVQKSFAGASLAFIPGSLFASAIADLPNVLILGDSISIGYFPFVKELLEGKANVTRPFKEDGSPENCQGTTTGVANIERWLGDTKWDVIHFNFGLHDLKHVDPTTQANSTNPDDPRQAEPKQYKENLEVITEKLKKTGAQLIYATTTPYPKGVGGPTRVYGDAERYNKIALKIMKKNKVSIDDLYGFVLPRMEIIQRPNNVHFTEEGSELLAEQVYDSILETFQKKTANR